MKSTLAVFLSLFAAVTAANEPADASGVLVQGSLRAAQVDTDTPPDLREAIIFFRPAAAVAVEPGVDAEMRMADKAFTPGVLAVTRGTQVRFPNTDPILHNAFSTSPQARFDLGFYGAGEAREQLFDAPGLIRVYCNVHHGMVGYVMVLDTPFFTQPDTNGKFSLMLPPDATGTVYVWHPQADALQQAFTVNANAALDFAVNFTGRRLPRHLNKHGRRYDQRTQRQY